MPVPLRLDAWQHYARGSVPNWATRVPKPAYSPVITSRQNSQRRAPPAGRRTVDAEARAFEQYMHDYGLYGIRHDLYSRGGCVRFSESVTSSSASAAAIGNLSWACA